jgi:hypothetical protein
MHFIAALKAHARGHHCMFKSRNMFTSRGHAALFLESEFPG